MKNTAKPSVTINAAFISKIIASIPVQEKGPARMTSKRFIEGQAKVLETPPTSSDVIDGRFSVSETPIDPRDSQSDAEAVGDMLSKIQLVFAGLAVGAYVLVSAIDAVLKFFHIH